MQLHSSSELNETVKSVTSSKKHSKYTPVLKEFACSLFFYSTQAYKFVRKTFLNSLPHPKTIRRWFSTIDLSPGISQPVLNSIKTMIEEERTTGKEVQFGLQFDEMSIKK